MLTRHVVFYFVCEIFIFGTSDPFSSSSEAGRRDRKWKCHTQNKKSHVWLANICFLIQNKKPFKNRSSTFRDIKKTKSEQNVFTFIVRLSTFDDPPEGNFNLQKRNIYSGLANLIEYTEQKTVRESVGNFFRYYKKHFTTVFLGPPDNKYACRNTSSSHVSISRKIQIFFFNLYF